MTNGEPKKSGICNNNCKGGALCAFCNMIRAGLKLICSPFRAIWAGILRIPSGISTNWETWREVIIIGGAMFAVLSIVGIASYVFLYGSNNRELPESLKNLLTLLTGYLFAYIPTSFAAQSAEKSRKESDARLQEVLGVLNNELIPAINSLREDITDVTAAIRGELRENEKYQDGNEDDTINQRADVEGERHV